MRYAFPRSLLFLMTSALCLIACLYGHDAQSEEVQQKILLYVFAVLSAILTCSCFSTSPNYDVAVSSGKPLAVQAITTATKQAVLPEVTTALANRAAQTYIANGIKVVSAHGTNAFERVE